jgi:type II secretory ATPase GspE/PulE/Tfp pilus assembly ATPase PilB-like protein
VATVARLFDLGLKPYVVAAALEGIVAQRLVRRICIHCREEVPVDARMRQRLGAAFNRVDLRSFKGKGCQHCNGNGYKRRVGIYEVLVMDDNLRDRIGSGASMLDISRVARQQGLRVLARDAADKVHAGETTLDEILRVLGPQPAEDAASVGSA